MGAKFEVRCLTPEEQHREASHPYQVLEDGDEIESFTSLEEATNAMNEYNREAEERDRWAFKRRLKETIHYCTDMDVLTKIDNILHNPY